MDASQLRVEKARAIFRNKEFRKMSPEQQGSIADRLLAKGLTVEELHLLQLEIEKDNIFHPETPQEVTNISQFQKFRDDLSNVDAERQDILYRHVMGMGMRVGQLLNESPKQEHAYLKRTIADPLFKMIEKLHNLDYRNYGGDEIFGKLKEMRYHPENYSDEQRAEVMERLRDYLVLAKENLETMKAIVAFFYPAVERFKTSLLPQDPTNDNI